MRLLAFTNACVVTFGRPWPSLRFHEPGELRLGEGQQRTDSFGFDIEDSRHCVGFDPLVA